MKTKALASIIIASQLTGCAGLNAAIKNYNEKMAAQKQAYIESFPMCESREECDDMMGAAQVWVANHSDTVLAVANNNMIENYGSKYGTSYKVSKVPMGGKYYRIMLESSGGTYETKDFIASVKMAGNY